MANTLHLRVRNREKIVVDQDIKALSGYNQKGIFDILPSHSNFISLVDNKIIFFDLQGKELQMGLTKAIMRVENNMIDIYLDILKGK